MFDKTKEAVRKVIFEEAKEEVKKVAMTPVPLVAVVGLVLVTALIFRQQTIIVINTGERIF
jgi:hypothetical protein